MSGQIYMTTEELEAVHSFVFLLNEVQTRHPSVSLSAATLADTNGDVLGYIEFIDGRYVFVAYQEEE